MPTLQCTLQCMGHAQKCITGNKTFLISKLGSWKHTLAFQKSSETNRYQTLKNLRQYILMLWKSVGNWQQRRRVDLSKLGDIGLFIASRESTRTNEPPKHYTQKGAKAIKGSPKVSFLDEAKSMHELIIKPRLILVVHTDDLGWCIKSNQQGANARSKPQQDCQQTNVTLGQILYCTIHCIPINLMFHEKFHTNTQVWNSLCHRNDLRQTGVIRVSNVCYNITSN